MHMKCHKMEHHAGHKCSTMKPVIFGVSMLLYMATALWLTLRITDALETMALTNTWKKMDDRLSDAEKDDIEGRVRENLFPE